MLGVSLDGHLEAVVLSPVDLGRAGAQEGLFGLLEPQLLSSDQAGHLRLARRLLHCRREGGQTSGSGVSGGDVELSVLTDVHRRLHAGLQLLEVSPHGVHLLLLQLHVLEKN